MKLLMLVCLQILALDFVPDWFVTNKKLEKPDNLVFSNDDIDFGF